MNFTDWFRAVFNLYPQERAAKAPPTNSTGSDGVYLDPRPIPSGRISTDKGVATTSQNWSLQEPEDYEGFWRLRDLDTQTLANASPKEILDMLLDLSPEISKAAWDIERLCNPGYEYKTYKLGPEKTEDEAAKEHVDYVFSLLKAKYGSVDVVLNRYFMGAFLRGAFCGELVLDNGATETIDLVAPDPFSIKFRKRADPLMKEVWEPGQLQGSTFVSLDIPTFRYIPVDPAPGSPYGRALAAPALFTSIFILSLLHDVKRVVMQQGYKRMDIVLNTEAARDSYDFDNQGYETLGEYIKGAIDAIKTAYASLQPDDAFIHTDIFTLNPPAGTIDSDSIGAINSILERLERQVTRALKSNSLIMDTGNNTNETDSNRRWEIHAAGIKSLQHGCESMLESLLNVSLQAKGIQAVVEFRFAELRASEMFRDEQTRQLRVMNSRAEYDAGYISQDEAALKTVKHAPDAPEPRQAAADNKLVQDNNSGNEDLSKKTTNAETNKSTIVFPRKADRVNA